MSDDTASPRQFPLVQPGWDASHTLETALQSLGACESAAEAREAYHGLLYALGNNHAGTYYPVVLVAIPRLAELLGGDRPWARRAALEALLDLCASFEPEPGFERVAAPDGEVRDLRDLLWASARQAAPLIRAIAALESADEEDRALAAELLAALVE